MPPHKKAATTQRGECECCSHPNALAICRASPSATARRSKNLYNAALPVLLHQLQALAVALSLNCIWPLFPAISAKFLVTCSIWRGLLCEEPRRPGRICARFSLLFALDDRPHELSQKFVFVCPQKARPCFAVFADVAFRNGCAWLG